MSKKKSKKNKKSMNPVNLLKQEAYSPEVKLSQCMIVKNEEKHIERALSWAKDIAYEQIVVDTGSTDRTVEIAESLGAKIFHFKWINDFSAAKNFAISKAKGNWIAFLDADEYFLQEDANELITILQKIQNNPISTKQYDAVENTMVHLDDKDNVIAVMTHLRIFKKDSHLKYNGKIHETINIRNKTYSATNLKIMHTGYASSVYDDANKRERNVELLRNECKNNPDDPKMMIYLADSLKTLASEEAFKEAEELYIKALGYKNISDKAVRQLAYDYLLPRFSGDERYSGGSKRKDEALKLCTEAIVEYPENIDYRYYRAILFNKAGEFTKALEDLIVCENAFTIGDSLPVTRVLIPTPLPLFYQQKVAAKGLKDEQAVLKYSTIINSIISESKSQADIIGSYIISISVFGINDDEVLLELTDVYDINNPKDLMFIARAAKDSGAIEFTRKIMEMLQILLNK